MVTFEAIRTVIAAFNRYTRYLSLPVDVRRWMRGIGGGRPQGRPPPPDGALHLTRVERATRAACSL